MTPAACRTLVIIACEEHTSRGETRRALNRACEMLDEPIQRVLLDVLGELAHAQLTHGNLPLDSHRRLGILTEEVLELTQATNDHAWKSPRAAAVRTEAVQVAAVALRMVVTHDQFTITTRP